MDISALKAKLDAAHYIYDDGLVTTLLVALKLGRPLLIEGAAGVGSWSASSATRAWTRARPSMSGTIKSSC